MNNKLNQTYTSNIIDLLEIQRASFYTFLFHGIYKELNSLIVNPFFLFTPDQRQFLIREEHSISEKSIKNICASPLSKFSKDVEFPSLLTPEKGHFIKTEIPLITADIYIYPAKIKIKGPLKSLSSCFELEETYATSLYLQGEIIQKISNDKSLIKNRKQNIKFQGVSNFKISSNFNSFKISKISIKKYFYLATIPFLTEDGSFFINGCERVVINQIVRSPGIYFKKEYLGSQKTNYTATFISDNWAWAKFTLENSQSYTKQLNSFFDTSLHNQNNLELKESLEKNKIIFPTYDIYVNLNEANFWKEIVLSKDSKDNLNELFLVDLILNLGFTIEEIFDNLQYPDKLAMPNISVESKLYNPLQSLELVSVVNKNLDKEDFNNQTKTSVIERLLDHIFAETDEKNYFSLGELGRYRINKRLGLNLPLTAKFLTALDFLKIIDHLIKLREENLNSDDIDDLKNKQIRGVGTLIQNQFRLAIFRWLKHPRYTDETFFELQSSSLFQNESYAKLTSKIPKICLNSFILSNHLRTIIDKSFREFFLTSQLSQYFDETNPLAELAHKRRISVFGPDGLQRDKINTKIRDIHPSQYGKICPIETPEGENAGLVMSLASFARVNQFGWLESPYLVVENGQILTKTKPFYLNSNQEEQYTLAFGNNNLSKTGKILSNFVSIKEGSYFSENEIKTLDFSALSQIQILSIGTSLVPFVEHNDANRALMGSNMQRQAIPLIFKQLPFIGTGFETNVAQESGVVLKSEAEGYVEQVSSTLIEIKDLNNQKITYKLKKYNRSNQETSNNQICFLWPGEKIYAGQVIADSPATINGELGLGANLLIGYLPWEGYNYEDAIVISERLVTQNILSSLHISSYQTVVKATDLNLKKVNVILKTTRQIRELKKIYKYFKTSIILNSHSPLKVQLLLKKISRKIIAKKQLFIKHLSNLSFKIKQSLGAEQINAYLGKPDFYVKRNLSSNGIIKIGADVLGGDVLVAKFQSFNTHGPKSSYQKLFEDLQQKTVKKLKQKKNYLFEKRIKKKDIHFSLLKNEKKKLKKILAYIKNLNINYFQILLLLKRLLVIKECLIRILISLNSIDNGLTNISLKNSLKIKYLIIKKHFDSLITTLKMELKQKNNLGFLLIRLLKISLKNFYFKLYKSFYFSQLQTINSQIFNNLFKFKNQLLLTKLNSSTNLLGYIYFKVRQKFFENLKFYYSPYTQDSFSSHLFNLNFNYTLPKTLQEIFIFNTNFTTHFASDIFFASVIDLKKMFKVIQNSEKNINSENLQNIEYKNLSLVLPLGLQGKILDVKILPLTFEESTSFTNGFLIKIFVLENRKIQIGDKLSGRHGNKGVISRILPKEDMPVLPNGTTLDILVNPLGVPSRMNVGQLLECLLGLSALHLGTRFKIMPFDEVFGLEASRVLVTQKLKQASLQTQYSWLYESDSPGKIYLRDGRTGEFFDNPITIGVAYILKLIHLVDDKMHSRALGPYNRVTEQPLQGKAASGGQRFGEMEVWALEAYGCANTLQELLTIKSDDIDGRNDLYKSISSGQDYEKPNPSFSETLLTLIRELNSLGLNFQFFRAFSDENTLANFTFASNKEIKIFNLIEERLKLRFISDNLKFRYPDLTIKDYKGNSKFIVQITNQTELIFKQLENF